MTPIISKVGENRARPKQDFLGQNCQQFLNRTDMKTKRRAAIAAAKYHWEFKYTALIIYAK